MSNPNETTPVAVPASDMQRWTQAEALVESLGWTWNASTDTWEPPAKPAEPKLIDIEGAMGLTG